MHPPVFLQTAPSAPPPPSGDELAMAMNASLHTTTSDPSNLSHHSISQASSSSGPSSSTAPPPPSGKASAFNYNSHGIGIVLESSPSAPPLTDDDIATVEEGPINYPSIDSTPVNVPSASSLPASTDGERKEDGSTGTCAICLDAPSEAVCVPCGHVAGCMSCLNEIKSKKWGCPVCRAKIDQVIKLYRVWNRRVQTPWDCLYPSYFVRLTFSTIETISITQPKSIPYFIMFIIWSFKKQPLCFVYMVLDKRKNIQMCVWLKYYCI